LTQRFTTDIDIVIPAQAVDDYTDLLTDHGYEKTADVEQSELYEGRTIRFTKDIGNPVRFDVMVDVLGCRQTEAEWVVSLFIPALSHRGPTNRSSGNSQDTGTRAAVCCETS
jgi:hypothetical protein